MTEAVTPPSPSPSDPRSALPPEKPGDSADADVTLADIRGGAAVALLVGVAGVLLGVLWAWLAPRVQYVSNGEAVFLRDTESEGRIGSDGTFLLLSAGLGALSAVATFLWRRGGGVLLAVGLGVGSVFAALVGWRLGLWLGPSSDLAAAAAKAGKGVPFDAPLQLVAYGVLLVWPMIALLVHLGLTAVWGTRDPVAADSGWDGPYPPAYVHPVEPPKS
ncbi:DUF2567 domain-containing protein [Streptomyces sp. APSN-46.1]|uniref:DUF2567 domain-containing protein n=1 Tax=Streptomyces sp. APSN-46.1 TaxID=2929049 RepID=UPI001FB1C56A|nr:DUF2567 domain-containing protein [Streptomyces sp. APSN-46.1]MCJ1681213.1 DUF2567 domain-containing protein [Streptomyces sp. APSN-46.1]